jgi:hypothetical protein
MAYFGLGMYRLIEGINPEKEGFSAKLQIKGLFVRQGFSSSLLRTFFVPPSLLHSKDPN